jgi:hypothetical protein
MQIRPDEWKKLFELRDDLEDEDRTLMRKFIKYIEHLEIAMRLAREMLRIQGKDDK